MNRSLIIGIISTLALFSCIAIYFYFNNIKVKSKSALVAVPNDAFAVIQSKEVTSAIKHLTNSTIWNDLIKNSSLNVLSNQLTALTNFVNANEVFKDALEENNNVVSLHNYNGKFACLLINELGRDEDPINYASAISMHIKGSQKKRLFEKTIVYDIYDELNQPFISIAIKDRLLLCAKQSGLVDDAIRKLTFNLNNPSKGLEQLGLLADNGADLNLFLNFQKTPAMFNLWLKPIYFDALNAFKHIGNWSLLNIELGQSEFNLQGVTLTDDSLFQFLDLFKNQSPKELTLQQYMPANTAISVQMGFTDYLKFNEELTEYLQAHQLHTAYAAYADSLEKRYNIDLTQKPITLIDGEAALILTEPSGNEFTQNMAAIIRFKDPQNMYAVLKNAVTQMAKKGETDSVTVFHQGLEIEQIRLGNFLKLYYGQLMESIYSPYFAKIEDVIVFSNSLNNLTHIIDQYNQKLTLATNESFVAYQTKLNKSNNISITINPFKFLQVPGSFITEEFYSTLSTNQNAIKKFEFVNIGFANTDNKAFYTQVNYLYANQTNATTKQLWTYKLDTTFTQQPEVVYSTKLRQNVVFVQDVKNTLYCLSSQTGALIWRSKLSAPLVGHFKVVDVKNNGTNQYLFATQKQLFLVDEDGVSLNRYPINLPGKAFTDITLTNFGSDTLSYILVPLENKRVAGFSIGGYYMPGLNPKIFPAKLTQPLQIIQLGVRALIYSADANGALALFNRKGKSQNIESQIWASNYWHVPDADTNKLIFNAIDSNGLVQRLEFDSSLNLVKLSKVAQTNHYTKVVANNINWSVASAFMLFDSLKTTIWSAKFDTKFEITVTDTLHHKVFFTQNASGNSMVGQIKNNKELIWLDMSGKPYPDFPLPGCTQFYTGNILGNNQNQLIGGDQSNNIFLFQIR